MIVSVWNCVMSYFCFSGQNSSTLAPPLLQSPGGSPTKILSAQASPTNTVKQIRPRAKSADSETTKKIVSACDLII